MARKTEEKMPPLPKIPVLPPTIEDLIKTLKKHRKPIENLIGLSDDRLEELLQLLYDHSYDSDAGAELKVNLDKLLDEIVDEMHAKSGSD